MSFLALLLAEGGEEKPWYQVGDHGNHWWLPHDLREVILGTIAFLIVVWFLSKKAGPAIKKALADRTARITNELASAKSERVEAEQRAADIKAALADRDAKIAEIEAEALETAAQIKVDLIARAEADAANIVERGLADVESTRRQALSDLSSEIGRTSLTAAERVIEGGIDEEVHQDLIDQFIAQLSAGSGTKA
jgi:F-type H+-transporting ATPase subunit b